MAVNYNYNDLVKRGVDHDEAMAKVIGSAKSPTGPSKVGTLPATPTAQNFSANMITRAINSGMINANDVQGIANKYGGSFGDVFGSNAVPHLGYNPDAVTTTATNKMSTPASGGAPTFQPFNMTPQTMSNEEARRQAGLRAFQQVQPEILARQNQIALAQQGVEMLRQRLQLGVNQTADTVNKQAPKFVDNARRLRASQGLSESGFLAADQRGIYTDALDTIAQAAAQAQLQEGQEASRVGLENRGTEAEIARLLGMVSTDDQGNFTGSLVDTIMQDIMNNERDFGLRERDLAFRINNAQQEYELNRYRAEQATRQGDAQLAAQYAQMAQTNQRALDQLNLQRDQFAENNRRYEGEQPFRDLDLEQARTSLDQSKALFPGQLTQQDQSIANNAILAERNQLMNEMQALENTIARDGSVGLKAEAQMRLREIETRISQINNEIAQSNKPKVGTGRTFADIEVGGILNSLGVTDIGNTERADNFAEWAQDIQVELANGATIGEILRYLESEKLTVVRDKVDPEALRRWVINMTGTPPNSNRFNPLTGSESAL
jgi:hypothetical protein